MKTDSIHCVKASRSPELYQCPRTRSSLAMKDGALVGCDGSVRYEVNNGVPKFLSHVSPESDDTNASLKEVVELVSQKHWSDAVKDVYGDWGYIYPDGRDKWVELLSIEPDNTVLEIGPGMGQFTPILCKKCETLYALEVVPEQAQFASMRVKQEGCENAQFACGGDDCLLPYKDNSFDWVIFNLVFEWCATRNESGRDFVSGQSQMLSEINRVLKPGGKMYLQTKNRYALRLILGKRDEHCYSMRWGNALPRALMNLCMRKKCETEPRGVLHSHNALIKMLRKAGFGTSESYWATPEMRNPKECISTDPAQIRAARKKTGFVQGEFRSTRLLMPWIPAKFVKHFTPGLLMIAVKCK